MPSLANSCNEDGPIAPPRPQAAGGLHYPQDVMRTVEALIDHDGHVRLLEPLHPGASCRALVVIFDDDEDARADGARLSEAALAQDWARPEEDEAWAPLQPVT